VERIVVGVDGSTGAQGALEWAIDEARRRCAQVEAVSAWSYVPLGGYVPDAIYLPQAEDELDAATHRVAGEAVAKALGDADDVAVRIVVVRDTAAHALLQASEGAAMLVVGSRGLGGFRGLLLGSVSHRCVHHAPCPVVVVPNDERRALQ